LKNQIIFMAALCAPATALAQDRCAAAEHRMRTEKGWAAAVMEDPQFGPTELSPGAARSGLVLARQTVRIVPRQTYLAAPVSLIDADGRDLAHSVPLGRGAPISVWRGAAGLKQCALGWQNGLFGSFGNAGHMRWVCFEDHDGDGRFDTAWRPWTKSLGLSYSRRDMTVSPQVGTLPAPPPEARVKLDDRATVGDSEFSRSLVVTRAEPGSLRIEYRLERERVRRTIERKDLSVGTGPVEVVLAGIIVTVAPAAGGAAMVSARGGFDPGGVKMLCDNSRVMIGPLEMATEFTFPNW